MNKEEYDKASTFDKIDYDIAMKSYFKHNDKIASINDHLGEIYDYSDLKDAEECELKDEIKMYREALKEKCDAIDKTIEYLEKSKLNQLDTYCKYLYIDFDTGKKENT